MTQSTKNEHDFSKNVTVHKKSKQEADRSTVLFFAFITAIAGLIGLHHHIEYSGWLIFLAFCML
jgi:hypothetical protein